MEQLEFAVEVSHRAGDILKHYASREKQIEHKGRANLVTVADRESERLIVQEIRWRYPQDAILAEESGLHGGPSTHGSAPSGRWIIDPLDGTSNYAHRFPTYCVSIGYERHGSVRCGVVYDPLREETFSAARGEGSFLNGDRIEVSRCHALTEGLLLTGFPYDVRDRIETALGLFKSFLVRSQAVRRSGAAALDLCYLAAGRCDGFWELGLQPWDTAAALVIVEEAGGVMTDFRGRQFSIEGKELLASNGSIHSDMIAAIADSRVA